MSVITTAPEQPAAQTDFRDITVANRCVRIVANPATPTIPIFEVPDPCVTIFIGRVVAADAKLPKLLLAKDNTEWAREQRHRDMIRAAALAFWNQVRRNHIRSTGTLGLPVLDSPRIAGRTMRLALVHGQPRIRVTFADYKPFYVGTVIELDSGHPRFIAGPAHLDWVRTADRIRQIVDQSRLAHARQSQYYGAINHA
jgi:hypothetical protein